MQIVVVCFWRKFWSPGPKFSQENMVRLLKNWSRLKTLILGLLLKQENIIVRGEVSNITKLS